MDWALAIAINQSTLNRIVAALIAMVGLSAQEAVPRLPRPLYRIARGVLRRAEAALRRLIVIAARDVVIKPRAYRPMPAGLVLPARSGAGAAFRLFDAPKRFARIRRSRAALRIRVLGPGPLVPLFQPRVAGDAEPERDDGKVDAKPLARRLLAAKLALENLPRQAKRLKRCQARRQQMAKFTSPLRQGLPPGHRATPKDEVDRVLSECHALARDALREDSS